MSDAGVISPAPASAATPKDVNDFCHPKHSNQWSVNPCPPFCIFFKKTADLAARLHASFAHYLPQWGGTAPFSHEIQLSTKTLYKALKGAPISQNL